MNTFCNIERMLERRSELSELSQLHCKNKDCVIPDNKIFYEYSNNNVWFRESLIATVIDRVIANPVLKLINTAGGRIKEAINCVDNVRNCIQKIIDTKNCYTTEVLGLILGVTSSSPIKTHIKGNKHLSDMDKKVIFLIAVNHLRAGDTGSPIDNKSWEKNKQVLQDCVKEFKIQNLFLNDCYYRNIWYLSVINLKRVCYIFFHSLEQICLDLTERLKKQGQGMGSGASKDAFANNDGSERGVGIRKYNKNVKPNVSRHSNGVQTMATQNGDS